MRPTPAEDILEQVTEAKPTGVVCLGFDSNGEMFFGTDLEDKAEILWLLENAKADLMASAIMGD
jgi:hypothetical protein